MSQTIHLIFLSSFILFAITVKEQIIQPCYTAGRQNEAVEQKLLCISRFMSNDLSDGPIVKKDIYKIGSIREI